jgi:hypothetical protein
MNNSCLKSAVRVDQQKPFFFILAILQNSGIYFKNLKNRLCPMKNL